MISVDVSPSRHHAHVPRCGAGFGQGHWLDVVVDGDGMCQLQHHDVEVQSLVVVTLMPVDGVHGHELLRALVHPDVIVTQDGNLCIGAEIRAKNKMTMVILKMQLIQKLLNALM